MISVAQLVGARADLRAAGLAQVEERVLVHLLRLGVVHDVPRDDVACTGFFSHVSIQKASMRTISFCSSPIEPLTSIM